MNISFAWTTAALLCGFKTVTRRCWSDSHARHFHKGQVCGALDRLPFMGGRRVADIEIVDVRREPLDFFRDTEYARKELAAEGGLWASAQEFTALFKCAAPWRVEFKLLRVIGEKGTQ